MIDQSIKFGQTSVGDLLREQANIRPLELAVEGSDVSWTYGAFNERVNRLANFLVSNGFRHGDRVAILSENRPEYMDVEFAAAKLGMVVVALNWRLVEEEQLYCIQLTRPKILFVSPRFTEDAFGLEQNIETIVKFDSEYELLLSGQKNSEPESTVNAEDPLLILFTSGTTGRPKGAIISHRAFVSRVCVFCSDYGMTRLDTFAAWAPMFHMASTDLAIGMLLIGGKVVQIDGFDVNRLMEIISSERLGWLVLMPGVIDRLIDCLKVHQVKPKGILMIGAMPDLLPRHQLGEITSLLCSPYLNSFGSTETGIPPCSGSLLRPGATYSKLSKVQNSFCEVRLVDSKGQDVPEGTTGELIIRGPTLFSGYWSAPEANKEEFMDGWFKMGDLFCRNADGSYDFVDRAKYLIKSGGENIYPAEIERVLLEETRVAEVVVVRKTHKKWGEVPIAVVARKDPNLTEQELLARCRERLAGYKQPKQIIFVGIDSMPRSTTGKIQRRKIESLVI